MKIAICGAGLVGSYLHRLLSHANFGQITIFDSPMPHKTSCGISPCAWGTTIGFRELIAAAGLEPAKYILQTSDSILMNELKVKAVAIVFDKPKLIADLLNGVTVVRSSVRKNEFDRIIDATGVARAYLPAINSDVIGSCIQYRVYSREPLEFGINISNLGYAWRFPLSNDEYHIGAGSVVIPPRRMLDKLDWLKNTDQLCACGGGIRLTSPHYSLPLVDMAMDRGHCTTWGVGEAIGCVSPLVGEGIISGLKSARLLLANWEDPSAYQRAILKEFSSMKEERKVVEKARQGKRIGLIDAWVLKNSTKRLSMNLELYQALRLLRSITKIG